MNQILIINFKIIHNLTIVEYNGLGNLINFNYSDKVVSRISQVFLSTQEAFL